MTHDNRGKKLLILEGHRKICEIVDSTRSMGVYTVVTDYYDILRSPAKLYADRYFDISNADIDSVLKIIREENIDGVINGFNDSTLIYYQQICKSAGLPCYITEKQVQITTDKARFKQLCRDFSVPTVKEYKTKEAIQFPVLVKPSDSSGGRGVRICSNQDELIKNIVIAEKFSPSGRVIIEKYISGLEVTIFYAIQDGKFVLTGMSDRYARHKQGKIILLPVAHLFPSVYLKIYEERLNRKVIEMFRSIGVKNGIIFIQAFVDNSDIIFYEMGFRLTGTQEYHILRRECGISTMDMMVNFALTGKMNDISCIVSPHYKKHYCLINFLVKPGRIAFITGKEDILRHSGVFHVIHEHKVNSEITQADIGTLRQIAIRVYAEADSRKELADLMEKVHSSISIISNEGENMLLNPLDTKEVLYEPEQKKHNDHRSGGDTCRGDHKTA